jgi:PPE-repeat protein
MWAQDATAMYQYAANSVAAAEVTTFTSPPNVTNPVGVAQQAVAAEVTAVQGSVKSALTNLVSSLPATLQSLTSPATAASSTSNISSTLSTVFSSTTLSNAAAQITSDLPQYAATYFMAAATPLYGMSSILGMAQTAQGLANAAGQGVAAAAQGAANAAASGAGAVESLGRGVVGSIGSAATLGPLAVPASWTSVIPTAHMGAAAALPNAGIGGANLPPSLLGGLPRTAAPRTAPGPRYGIVPTAMTRPPSAG